MSNYGGLAVDANSGLSYRPPQMARTLLIAATVALAACGQKPYVSADLVMASSLLPAECEGDVSHCEVLTSFRGVNVYRNIGETGFCSNGYCSHPQNRYGTRWQCVELFNRFFAQQYGIQPIHADARELFVKAATVPGLESRPNGGSHPPEPGDALVFGGTRTGHVAIVVKVTSDHVHVVEQNVPGDGTNAYAYHPATRTVAVPPPAIALGWIHAATRVAPR